MDVSETGSVYGPDYSEILARKAAEARRANHAGKTTTSNTVGTPVAPTGDEYAVPSGIVTSNTGPGQETDPLGNTPNAQRNNYAKYAVYIFEDLRLQNEAQILSLMSGGAESMQALQSTFQELGEALSEAAGGSGVGTVLYHLNGNSGLEDSHVAEGMGLDQFLKDDGTFDLPSALAEMSLIREGERGQDALEKEASYLDATQGDKQNGNWGTYRRGFEELAAKGALLRETLNNPDFAGEFAENPKGAIGDNLHSLTNKLMNTTIAYEKGEVKTFF